MSDLKPIGYFLAVLMGLAVFMMLVLWGGLAFWLLWGWFAVPLLKLPELGFLQALGLSFLFSYATHQRVPANKDESGMKSFWYVIQKPILFIVLGYIVQRVM